MTKPTRIYKHSSAGTDWAALLLGAGLGLTLALQLTKVRKSDFTSSCASLTPASLQLGRPLQLWLVLWGGSVMAWQLR
jgi:hypothetical protein